MMRQMPVTSQLAKSRNGIGFIYPQQEMGSENEPGPLFYPLGGRSK
jgi:hypothetical protein